MKTTNETTHEISSNEFSQVETILSTELILPKNKNMTPKVRPGLKKTKNEPCTRLEI